MQKLGLRLRYAKSGLRFKLEQTIDHHPRSSGAETFKWLSVLERTPKPGTSLLWCNSANHGTTFPPAVSHKTQYFHRTNASLSYYSQVILFCSPVLLALPSPAHFTGTSNHVARRSVRQNLGGGWRWQHLVSPTNQFKRPTILREHHDKKSSNVCLAKI